jgi:DNA-binding NarL/FixJ family response regulator
MAILLVTQDRELEARCRRAVSAHHAITVIDAVTLAPGRMAAAAYEVVLIDAETLVRPYAEKVAGIVSSVSANGVGRVIVMTTEFIEDEEVALLRCGVQGCCRRGIDPESLAQVLSVTESGVWVTRSLLPRLVTELRRYAQQAAVPAPPVASMAPVAPAAPQIAPAEVPRIPAEKLAALTRRERDIVKLLADGATNKQVAQELDITERTVKGHLSNVFMKLGVHDRLKLVLFLNGGQQPQQLHK